MITCEVIYKLTLDREAAEALKDVLGGLNNDQFKALGVEGDARSAMSEIYDLLPYRDDE